MKIEDSQIEFSSGNQKSCLFETVGIDGQGNVTGGYDEMIYQAGRTDETLPKEDLVELADFMIARWTAFRAAHE